MYLKNILGGGGGIGCIYMIRRPYVIVFYFRTISICEEKLWKDLHCKSWYQCIMNRKVSMYRETSWFAWPVPWHNFTHHSNLGSFFFLFHSLIATSSKIYQMMALLINILFAKKNNNNFPWKREREIPFDKRFVPAKSLIHWELPIEEKLTTLDTWLISLFLLYK